MQSWRPSRHHLRSLLQRLTQPSAAGQQLPWQALQAAVEGADWEACCCSAAAMATSASPRPEAQQQQQQRQGQQRGVDRRPAQLEQASSSDSSPAQRQRLSLAMQNAPRKVFELIGDPRTGLADDVTSNPFGEITVDMVHHQASNEVYWYKYEYAGNMLQETHRDCRLSEQAKNLIYILRAKDPNRSGAGNDTFKGQLCFQASSSSSAAAPSTALSSQSSSSASASS